MMSDIKLVYKFIDADPDDMRLMKRIMKSDDLAFFAFDVLSNLGKCESVEEVLEKVEEFREEHGIIIDEILI